MAIGARSQSARTYLEKKLDSFLDGTCDVYPSVHSFIQPSYDLFIQSTIYYQPVCPFIYLSFHSSILPSIQPLASLDELINHGLLALRECLPNDSELTSKVLKLIDYQMFLS